MSTLEERLRQAMEAEGATVQAGTLPPLRLPRRRGVGAVPRGFLVVAAAAVTLAVILAGLMVGRKVTPPLANPLPRFIVSIVQQRTEVRDAATGKVIAPIPAPARNTRYVAAGAAADNRTFFLTAVTRAKNRGTVRSLRVYRVRLDETGRPSTPTVVSRDRIELPPWNSGDSGLAASPDGSRVAFVALTPDSKNIGGLARFRVMVVDVASGHVRTWTARPGAHVSNALSWAANNRHLLLEIAWDVGGDGRPGYRILDTHAPGTDPERNSRPVPFRGPFGKQDEPRAAFLSQNGRSLIVGKEVGESPAGMMVISEISLVDGHELRRIARWPVPKEPDAQGRYLSVPEVQRLLVDGGGGHLLTVRHGRLVRMDMGTGAYRILPIPVDPEITGPGPLAW